ncbi:MAG TPA: hypothetical protein VMB52_03445, partial [Verrucomicrobiae bacterium]|nr:hypothetical protein [Verrucomicrobiae bacterium]
SYGHIHFVMPVLAVLLVGSIGTYVIVTHAQTVSCNTYTYSQGHNDQVTSNNPYTKGGGTAPICTNYVQKILNGLYEASADTKNGAWQQPTYAGFATYANTTYGAGTGYTTSTSSGANTTQGGQQEKLGTFGVVTTDRVKALQAFFVNTPGTITTAGEVSASTWTLLCGIGLHMPNPNPSHYWEQEALGAAKHSGCTNQAMPKRNPNIPIPSVPGGGTVGGAPTTGLSCNYRDDIWSGDASKVKYSITDLSSKNGNPASFSVKQNATKGTTEVVAYPDVQCILTAAIPSNLTSSFKITPPASPTGLDYEFAYDLWINTAAGIKSSNPWANNQEVMIWTYNNGQRPGGSVEGTLPDGSKVWGENTTTNGVGPVSVVLPQNETSGTVNISNLISELRSKGYINNSDTGIDDVEYGIEAPYGGGQTFTVNSLSVTE